MGLVGPIYESLPESIRMPDSLKSRPVQVILSALDGAQDSADKRRRKRKSGYLCLGAWRGESVIRFEQGGYEIKEPLG